MVMGTPTVPSLKVVISSLAIRPSRQASSASAAEEESAAARTADAIASILPRMISPCSAVQALKLDFRGRVFDVFMRTIRDGLLQRRERQIGLLASDPPFRDEEVQSALTILEFGTLGFAGRPLDNLERGSAAIEVQQRDPPTVRQTVRMIERERGLIETAEA